MRNLSVLFGLGCGAVLAAGMAMAQAPAVPATGVSLADAPLNTWVKLEETKTGGRVQPVFLYAGGIKKFILAAGMQATGGTPPRHYDTEEFDPAAGKWLNAYPAAVAAGRPESGPVGEDYSKAREKQGWNGPEWLYKDGDAMRLGAGGQWLGTATTYDWCYVPDNGRIYVSIGSKLFAYDTKARTWEDLKTKPRAKANCWGSLCYDPVNKEILHTGGGSGSAEVSTWAYNLASNEWRQLEFGSPVQKALYAKAAALVWQAKLLVGGCANRFSVTETPAEAKADLGARAAELVSAGDKLASEIEAAGLSGAEKVAAGVAAARLKQAVAGWKALQGKLAGKITPELIAEARVPRAVAEQAQDALASEPPGRARSQTAYDPVHKKIVLFGGDGLDRALSDTWLYDCATRAWEQRFPAKVPAPRAGHILAWLPKAQKIVLAGGYSRVDLAQQVWTYDVASDAWTLLLHVPLAPAREGRYSPNTPPTHSRITQVGAVNDDDVLVCPTSSGAGGSRTTWACKIDATKMNEADFAANAVLPGSYVFNPMDPAIWENVAKPDPEKTRQYLASLPVNQWTALQFPKYAPGARNRWGTSAYDPDRHQFLLWGGGHATSHENDVAHYSVLGNCWTIGYAPDDPIETVYANQPTVLSFRDRAHVPIHAYKAYAYDPGTQKMFYMDHAYNLAARDWESAPYPGLKQQGTMGTFLIGTPGGIVSYCEAGFFRLDAKSGQWQKLPWNGPAFGKIWCDGHTMRYDSKRDCLWFANEKTVIRYDLATGKVEKVEVVKPKAIGQFLLYGEAVYVPEADLFLLMNLFTKPDGKVSSVAWDPNDAKFYWASLAFVENGKPVEFKGGPFSWSDAMHYDPALKLVLLNNSSAGKVWALRFDRAAAALEEIKD
jgi:hypothetical protein